MFDLLESIVNGGHLFGTSHTMIYDVQLSVDEKATYAGELLVLLVSVCTTLGLVVNRSQSMQYE